MVVQSSSCEVFTALQTIGAEEPDCVRVLACMYVCKSIKWILWGLTASTIDSIDIILHICNRWRYEHIHTQV